MIEHASGAEEATAHLAQLCTAIRQEAADCRPNRALPRNALSRRLLGLVRTAFVERVAALPPPDPAQLLRLLARHRSGGPAARGRLGPALRRPALRRPTGSSWWSRWPTTSARRSPRSCFSPRPCSGAAAARSTPVQERQLGLIYSAAFGLSSVASDVIELARGGDRLVDLDPIPFSVTDILESVRDIVQPIAEEKGLAVRLTPPEARLPDRPSGRPQPGAAQPHHQRPQVHRRRLRRGDRRQTRRAGAIEFSVRDTGRGHSAAVHGDAVRAVPPPPEARRVRLLRLGARACPSAASWSRRWAPH